MCCLVVSSPSQPIAGQPAPVLLSLPRPVYFRSYTLRKETEVELHQHPFAEFLYAREGSMRVEIEGKTMIVPVLYGVWIPAHVPHRILASSDVLLESLYIESNFAAIDHKGCKVVIVSDFIREFIHYATGHVPEQYAPEGNDAQLVRVLITLLQQLPDAGLSLPWPYSPSLIKVCHKIQQAPDEAHSIEQWSAFSGMSVRTFSRHFKKETGVAFSEWKKRMRLLESVVMLKSNRSVTQVALDLGYASTASFTFAFRQMFGVPPTRY
ncbi:AraC family transcriptional regulator [Pectobacterium betavasculorum]|uniref:AraC family transcriptional regulator n=1 Tax=Pectobacterium betavasculorum TaxID=55207 RepID=A0A093UZ34_9GAMM|nr:helix-turn-helix transcriptional regulator [Pectobacterium betavasculorum]KFX05879.1 AraC family transcriptional regulator [Pectobacterium betavasculorum]KFX13488.1 AraC family transcriptional regulator [Pectobacterium betavasculorum]